jgi:hypothetical protein
MGGACGTYGGEVHTGFWWGDLKNGDIRENLETNEDEVKGEGKGKGKVHPRTGREGPEGIIMKFYIRVFFRKFVEIIQGY